MSKIKNISEFSAEQLEEFLMSFDTVMSDIDGVISYNGIPIEGARESLKRLESMGKEIYLVTNNNTYTVEDCYKILDIHPKQLITSTKVIIWYLKKIDFHGEIVAIVSCAAWESLTEAGFQLVKPRDYPVKSREKKEVIQEVLDRPSVKAVIIDFDVDCNWSKLALAISCLKRKDVLYISGAMDEWIIVYSQNSTIQILGPGPLLHLVNTQSGREPHMCAKPSETLRDYVLETCNVTNPRRCLFIGDSLKQDMTFGSMCGFMKLFVGTGINSLEQVQEENDACPEYYLPSLTQLFTAYND